MRRVSYTLTALLLTLAPAISHDTPASEAAVGSIVHQIGNPALGQPPLPFPGAATFCSIGLAFDGTSLYYNRCGDPNIYRINPITALLVPVGGDGGIFNPGIAENPNAMAFDKKRNGLWIGAQGCNATGMPIYFWSFSSNAVSLMFTIPFSLINPASATGDSFLSLCFVDGLAYNENGPGDLDDEIWFSDDVNQNLGVFRPTGVFVAGYDATIVNASLSTLSGLAIGGANLYMANDGGGDVFRASVPALTFVDQFTSGDERQEDMECDPVTFSAGHSPPVSGPVEVMWVRTTPQGGQFPDVITAFEIEPKTCGLGGQTPCEDPHAVCTITVGAGGLATVQAAYSAAVNDDVICLFANTTENVVLNGAKSLTITQCTTARVTAANNSLPVWTVSSTGKLTIIGPDAKNGSIGWLVEGDGHDIKGVRATGASEAGIKITGDNNGVSFNSVSGSPLGVKIEGTGNDVRGGTVSDNSTGVEFSSTASNNRFRGAKVRDNRGPGIVVEGPGNTLDGNRVNGNTGDGIHITATAAGTKLKSNQSGNPENGGAEYRLDVNAVNQGGNRADNIPIPKLSAPQKCAFFPAAGTCE